MQPRPKSESGIFLKLNPGDKVSGVLRGEFLTFEKAFKPGDKPKFRFRVNFITKTNGVLEAKIFEGGSRLYDDIYGFHTAGWDLKNSFIQIERQGSGLNTQYKASLLPAKPTEEQMRQVETIKLLDLSPEHRAQKTDPSFIEDTPF